MVDNKVVFITGAASGIGYETGAEFARMVRQSFCLILIRRK